MIWAPMRATNPTMSGICRLLYVSERCAIGGVTEWYQCRLKVVLRLFHAQTTIPADCRHGGPVRHIMF